LWEGAFSVHPMTSTTIPAGSQSWHNTTGNSFRYVITVPGEYNYKCEVHTGMRGSFTVDNGTAVGMSAALHRRSRVPALSVTGMRHSENLTIRIVTERPGMAELQVTDLHGVNIASIKNMGMTTGINHVRLKGAAAPGWYCIRMKFNGAETGHPLTVIHY